MSIREEEETDGSTEKKNRKRECERKRKRGTNECTNDERKKVIVSPSFMLSRLCIKLERNLST